MTFAAIETSVNAACASSLANATAVWRGASVAVIFRAEEQPAGAGQVVGSAMRVMLAEAPLTAFGEPSPKRGDELRINGVDYTVGTRDVDATGWLKLSVSKS